ncbi:DUF2778 domain-containing protein [Methylobacterium organophilum]|uniref:DUF2778 domain-containing protein n=1 Tax=Methylobacterium organophilum TaxID=410 RepID=UPI001F145ACE|nr:DUF2778 domain-containing protein [Methylobacterium organophilum]UMY17544.1 DUF2778 domain-containing protein [Methylobacterium organophilum]
MDYVAYSSIRRVRRRSRSRNRFLPMLALAAIGAAGYGGLLLRHDAEPVAVAEAPQAEPPAPEPQAPPAPSFAWMLDPSPALGRGAQTLGLPARPVPAARLAAALPQSQESAPAEAVTTTAALPAPKPAPRILAETPAAAPKPVAQAVPLPVSRPPELRPASPPQTPRILASRSLASRAVASRVTTQSTRSVFAAATPQPPAAERSFFETIFGGDSTPASERSSATALAYAGPDSDAIAMTPRNRLLPAPPSVSSAATAVYDITAQRVYLPSGEVLEAHSGLGAAQDNPNHVHLRMRGATPPGTYDLREREALFHGVRAIRLTPVGGSGTIYGRNGLLAHTYMLGASGASNGCVVFRNYDRFLQAYLRGEVRRLVVVASGGRDAMANIANR